jgi:hypothetical protein
MSEQVGGEGTNQKARAGSQGANPEKQPPRPPVNNNGSNGSGNHDRKPDPPNWVEKGTLVALVLTLAAAGWAASEADRLARDTETALSDARIAAQLAHADNVKAQNLTTDALRQSTENASQSHGDSTAANSTSIRAIGADNRAWIADLGVADNLTQSPKKPGDTLKIFFRYENVGKEPATDTLFKGAYFNFASVRGANGIIDMRSQPIPENTACDRIEKEGVARGTIFPVGVAGGVYAGDMGNGPIVGDDFFSDNRIYGVQGCIRYKTFGKYHLTKFCYLALRAPVNQGICQGPNQLDAN